MPREDARVFAMLCYYWHMGRGLTAGEMGVDDEYMQKLINIGWVKIASVIDVGGVEYPRYKLRGPLDILNRIRKERLKMIESDLRIVDRLKEEIRTGNVEERRKLIDQIHAIEPDAKYLDWFYNQYIFVQNTFKKTDTLLDKEPDL